MTYSSTGMKAKIILLLIFSIVFLQLGGRSMASDPVIKTTTCEGGQTQSGYKARYSWYATPTAEVSYWADDYHFIAYAPAESEIINYWKVKIQGVFPNYFDDSEGTLAPPPDNKPNELYVYANDGDVAAPASLEVTVEFWLNMENQIYVKEDKWSNIGIDGKALPNRGWNVTDGPSQKTVAIQNSEPSGGETFKITNFEYYITTVYYLDLDTVPYTGTITTTYTLNPGDIQSFSLDCVLERGHVYFHYTMLNTTNDVISEQYGDHGIGYYSAPVGGVWVPVDKLGLLAPYIGLAATIIVATVATAIYAKRVKRRKEKQ